MERILAANRADAEADVRGWKQETDARVYRLYGLTPDERDLVKESGRR